MLNLRQSTTKLPIRHCLCLFCLFAFIPFSNAQNAIVDSLVLELENSSPDTNKVLLLNAISQRTRSNDIQKAAEYAREAMELAKSLGYDSGKIHAAYNLGAAQFYAGKFEEAKVSGQMGLDLSRRLGVKKMELSNLNLLGLVYKEQNKLDSTISFMFECIRLSEEIGDSSRAGAIYVNLGNLMFRKKDLKAAKKYYFKAKSILEEKGHVTHRTSMYLAIIHVLDNPKEKLEYLNKAIQLATENKDIFNLAYAYKTRGHIYSTDEKDYEKAILSFRKALEYEQQIKNPRNVVNVKSLLGFAYLESTQTDSAIAILQDALVGAEEMDFFAYKAEITGYLADAFEQKKDYKRALYYLKDSGVLKDTLFSDSWSEKLNEANVKYETSKKEAQLAEQKFEIAEQKNRQNRLIITGLALLVIIVGIFQYFYFHQRRKKQQAELALSMEQQEAERLRQLDEMKTQFFTNVSHELRTPLTLIISPLEEALKKLKQVALEPDLQLAHRNSRHLLGLVNEVLDLAKLEAGKLDTEQSEVELAPLLSRLLFSFQSAAELKGVSLEFEMDLPDGTMIKTDISKLEKILNNLISNALKFTFQGGTVSLKAIGAGFEKRQNPGIMVSDTGQGIHPDDLPQVFDRFFQSKKRKPSTESGTGIGLALARQLAKLLGGDLSAESDWGKGSRFTLDLPTDVLTKLNGRPPKRTSPAIQTEPASSQPASIEPLGFVPVLLNGQRPRVLIVEDNAEMSSYLKKAFSKDYDCKVAMDGEEALHVLATENFDLITSDVMMPKMDGFAFRQKINERPEWKHIPFILLTARTLESDKLKGLQLGIDDYITKPFSLPELKARMNNLLTNKQLRDKLREEIGEEESLAPEAQLLHDAEELVLEKIEDPNFSVEMMAKNLGYSPRQLSRVFGKLTGLTPVKFILELRLQKARQLLEERRFATVAEVRYEIGIESASYFTKKFTDRFGKNPKEYLGHSQGH